MQFGQGKYVYELVKGWGKHFYSPYVDVVNIGVDSKDQIYVFTRMCVDPVLVFNSQGKFLRCWGRNLFTWPHGLYVAPDDSVYCTDGDHTVRKFTTDGKLLMTLGNKNRPSDTGVVGRDYTTVKRSAGPFNVPTDVVQDARGDLYITDGYGNARVHKFSRDGEYLFSWGEPGRGPGQFCLPHSICVDGRGTLYVADRENNRVQLFDPEGRFLAQWEGNKPSDVFIHAGNLYLSEIGDEPVDGRISISPKDGFPMTRISVLNLDGEVLSRLGGVKGCAPGSFYAPHDLCVDSRGDIYVGELVTTRSGGGDRVPWNCHTLQKFRRIGRK